ncbi:MAG: hypothetical protein AAFQ36_07690 [Pseudomonadota bacterium]
MIRKTILACICAFALSACGVSPEDRALSGGLMGATIGIAGGAGGMGLGAALGIAAGTLTTSDDFNLGDPVWD